MTPITERDLKRSKQEPGVYKAEFEDGRTLFIVKTQAEANRFSNRGGGLFVQAVVVTCWVFHVHDPVSEVLTSSSPIRTRREALAAANEYAAKTPIGTTVADPVEDEEALAG